MKEFQGKTAVITGAGNGIGLELAKEAAKRKMQLVLVDIEKNDIERTLHIIEGLGAKGIALALDVSLYDNAKEMIKTAKEVYGSIDLLVNNAGIAVGGLIWEMPVCDYEWSFSINAMSQVYAMHEAIPIMLQQGTECHIVNVASVAGLATTLNMSAYHMSKHASVALSEGVHYDLAKLNSSIGVSVYCPAYMKTDLHHYERHRPDRFKDTDNPYYKSESYIRTLQRAEKLITNGYPVDYVGPDVFKAIEEKQFYIIPHHEFDPIMKARFKNIMDNQVPDFKILPGSAAV